MKNKVLSAFGIYFDTVLQLSEQYGREGEEGKSEREGKRGGARGASHTFRLLATLSISISSIDTVFHLRNPDTDNQRKTASVSSA